MRAPCLSLALVFAAGCVPLSALQSPDIPPIVTPWPAGPEELAAAEARFEAARAELGGRITAANAQALYDATDQGCDAGVETACWFLREKFEAAEPRRYAESGRLRRMSPSRPARCCTNVGCSRTASRLGAE